MSLLGLIGFPIAHSWSAAFFKDKWEKENNSHWNYLNFSLENISDLPVLLAQYPALKGFNVTLPYKKAILPYLDFLDTTAAAVGAVNTVKIKSDGTLVGYNTDVFGFESCLLAWLNTDRPAAVVLGNGGAAQAVKFVLNKHGIPFVVVSRNEAPKTLRYSQIDSKIFASYPLIIQTTPLGMFPAVSGCPDVPYRDLTSENWCYDLVYNPDPTIFLQLAVQAGAKTMGGLGMLHAQAEAAWAIWQSED